MKTQKKPLIINDKEYDVIVDIFDDDDLKAVCSIYNRWSKLSKDLN